MREPGTCNGLKLYGSRFQIHDYEYEYLRAKFTKTSTCNGDEHHHRGLRRDRF